MTTAKSAAETSVEKSEGLPDYAPMLTAYHRAYATELQAMLDGLPLKAGYRVLDLACGDGTLARWLGRRVAPGGYLVGLDLSLDYLRVAKGEADACRDRCINFAVGDGQKLPVADHAFDMVWCAQSLYSLPSVARTLEEMRRVVRPGGIVAVLENDEFHHILLPWPVELELAIRQAEFQAYASRSQAPQKFYIGRELGSLFKSVQLTSCRTVTYATDRAAPLGPDDRRFLASYLRNLQRHIADALPPQIASAFEALVDPTSDACLLNQPNLVYTCVDRISWGIKPDERNA